jgi:hypothetical protein
MDWDSGWDGWDGWEDGMVGRMEVWGVLNLSSLF